jgi:hypothetical protein
MSDNDSDRSMVLVTTPPPPLAPLFLRQAAERPTEAENFSADEDEVEKFSDKSSPPFASTSSHGFEVPEDNQVKQESSRSKKDVWGRYNGTTSSRREAIASPMPAQALSRSWGRESSPELSTEGAFIDRTQSSYANVTHSQSIAISTSFPHPQPESVPFTASPRQSRGSSPRDPAELDRSESPPRRFMSSPPPLSQRTLPSICPRSSIVDFGRSRCLHRSFQQVNASLETVDTVAPSLPGMASPKGGTWDRLGDYEESLLGSLASDSSRSTIKQSQRRESRGWM